MKGLAASQLRALYLPTIQFIQLRLDLVLMLILSCPLASVSDVNQDIHETTDFRPTKSLIPLSPRCHTIICATSLQFK